MPSHSWCRRLPLTLLALLPLGMSASALASTAVNGVRLGIHPDGVTRMVLDVSNTMNFRISHRDHPYRLVIETDDLAWKAKPIAARPVGAITGVHSEQIDGVLQVVVDLHEPAVVKKAFMLGPDEGLGWRFVMDIKTTSAAGFQAVATPQAALPQATSATVSAPPPVIAMAPPPAPPASLDEVATARALVQSAIDDILGSFAGRSQTPEEVQARMSRLIAKYADMRLEGQQILGRYWAKATPEQQAEFQSLLEKFLTKAVSRMVDEIPAGQRIEIKGAERRGDGVVVRTLASVPGERPTEVRWMVMPGSAGTPVITDVSTDGAAVLATLQADFTSVVRNAASQSIEALFEPLRRKISG